MKRLTPWRLLAILAASSMLILSACSSDDDTETADDTTAETAEETSTTEAAEETTTEAEGSGLGVILNDDFEILLASDPAAGSVTFNVSNEGPDFPHALTIVRAASVDDLPRKEANGAVDTDALDPADIIGETSIPMASGTAEDLTVDLEAGDYVFFCPIQDETRSHVAAGQIIAVTVGG